MSYSVILFTAQYPSLTAGERGFLDPEVEILASKFDRVVLVPTAGCRSDFGTLPENVAVDNSFCRRSLAGKRYFRSVLRAPRSGIVITELVSHPRILCRPYAFATVLISAGEAVRARSLLDRFILRNDINLDSTIFYTYWFGRTTLGIGLYKEENPRVKLVSRAHRSDLYEHLYDPPYIPHRLRSLSHIDRLYLISRHGKDYIEARYPQYRSKYRLARLGVKASGCRCAPSQDDSLRIVSCSYIKPVKRLSLLIAGLRVLAERHSTQKFHWTHIGGSGDQALWAELKRRSDQMPANVSVNWLGQVRNPEVHDYYRNNPVDVFVNLSVSEGLPVSVMEAISYGIPVVATGVGGTPEIVTERSGELLDRDPTPIEVAHALWTVIKDQETNLPKREAAFELWQTSFSARQNHQRFARDLVSLLE